jgi:endo-1,4-beta-xylanase
MKRMRRILAVIFILTLVIIPAGCTDSKPGGDGGGSGVATPQAASTVQEAETAQNTETAKDTVATQASTTADTAAASTATAVAPVKKPSKIQTELKSIKDVYKGDFLIGTAVSMRNLTGDRYELFKMHFNIATAENAMKPNALQPNKGVFTFGGADMIVKLVSATGAKMHGHTLVWHQQSPAWMNTDDSGKPLGREEALENLKTHIKTVMEHFGNQVISWDVVNEAMNDNPVHPQDWKTSLRQTPWLAAIGNDYVEQAFLTAREVLDAHPDWDIKLYYNDYSLDNQSKAAAVYNMVKELNDNYKKTHAGELLIDGIGMQEHDTLSTDPANVEKSLEKFISLGVEISITELDIQATVNGKYTEGADKDQAYLYARLFEIFKAHAANIKRVTFWGMDDGTSWLNASNPLPFDEFLKAKPAYYGVTEPVRIIAETK